MSVTADHSAIAVDLAERPARLFVYAGWAY